MSDKEINASLIPDNAVTEISKKVYDDVAHKPLTQVGDATESLMKMVFLPFKCLGMTADELENKYKVFINKTINKVPKENLIDPSPAVAGPLLEQVKYVFNQDLLVEMFSNLLAADMNIETEAEIHPSFSDNIRRMSSYDAHIMKYLATNDINTSKIISQFINTFFTSDCDLISSYDKANISFTFLQSLNLIYRDYEQIDSMDYARDLVLYDQEYGLPENIRVFFRLYRFKDEEIKMSHSTREQIERELFNNFTYAIQAYPNDRVEAFCVSREMVTLTEYGKLFIKHCLP